jgi:uncharacterized repeat protein (TIGR03803 family)
VLTTLGSFSNNGASYKGANPVAGLVLGGDGNFYGTTAFGGASNGGTLFKVTPTGVLTTLINFVDFPSALGAYPGASLIKGTDNNLYGTTAGGGKDGAGTVFRLRFGPTPVSTVATSVAVTTATLNGTVNPHGLATTVTFQYGTSPTLAGATEVAVTTLPAGTVTQAVSKAITGLKTKTRYYYRVVGKNAENTISQTGNILYFTTL